jgi:D-arabinose 1-dehydrogenase-like Zn-dependent alcohol dehydrogenase
MQAARFHGPDEGLVVEEMPRPEPGPVEVLVEVGACGLCHSDLHLLQGDLPIPTPRTLGHEVAGTVAETGAGVDHLDTGTTAWRPATWPAGPSSPRDTDCCDWLLVRPPAFGRSIPN